VAPVNAGLRVMPHGNAGWTIPIDPILDVRNNLDAWAEVLDLLRERAGSPRRTPVGPAGGSQRGCPADSVN